MSIEVSDTWHSAEESFVIDICLFNSIYTLYMLPLLASCFTPVRSCTLYHRFLARASIHDACSQFNTSEFQTRRSFFQELIYTTMVNRFTDVNADITDLQVSNIKRPSEYEEVVRNKESAKENINIAKNERPRALIEAETKKEEAATQGRINVQRAISDSRVILSKAEAEASSILTALQAEAKAYAEIMTSQGLSVDGLLSYLGVRVLAENNNTISVGFPAPAKIFN